MPTVMVSGGERFLERFLRRRSGSTCGALGNYQVWLDRRRPRPGSSQTDCNVTGLTENWYIARMAHLRGKLAIPHNWHGGGTTMANAQYVAAIPNRDYCELNQTRNPLKEEIFKEPLTVENGVMKLPDRPGFGVDLIDGVEKRFPYVPGSYSKPKPG